MERILSDKQQELLTDTRRQLEDVRTTLARFDADRDDQETLRESLRLLDELFLLVVAGEFNSGKSTFINALLGLPLLEEGVTPTTTRIHTLTFGEREDRSIGDEGIERITAPVDLLREVQIVDTPGTNALDRRHEVITQRYIPRSDLVLFVTSADRPFTESERAFIEQIRGWGKKLVFVVNKIDILPGDGAVAEIVQFIVENAERLLGFTPEVFPVSARQALDAKISDGGHPPPESRWKELEEYLVDTLDQRERVRLKLLNPIGVGLSLVGRYFEATEGRLDLLAGDVTALDDIERQLTLYQDDLTREFRFRLTDVDNVLHEFEKRGLEFFDETIRLTRIPELINKDKIKDQFERKVVADAPREIEQKIDEIIDWMVGAELRQWQTVNGLIAERRAQHSERIVGQVGTFDYDRTQLLETVGRAAQKAVDGYDRSAEAGRLAGSVRTSVAGLALLEVGALGLGAIITALATTTLVDVTGILAAGTLATIGLFVLPARRARAKAEFRDKIAELRAQLMSTVTDQFEREIERSLLRVREAISPYTRFVRAERERLEEMRTELHTAEGRLRGLERRVGEL